MKVREKSLEQHRESLRHLIDSFNYQVDETDPSSLQPSSSNNFIYNQILNKL